MTSKNVLANTLTLVDEARKKRNLIIHAPLIIDPENKRGWLARLTFGKAFTKGTRKAQIMERFGSYLVSDCTVTMNGFF